MGGKLTVHSCCPKCKRTTLNLRVLSDSDDRVHAKWIACASCGYDERAEATGRQALAHPLQQAPMKEDR